MAKHVRVLGWLYIIMGILNCLGALAFLGFFSGVGFLSGDWTSFGVLTLIGGLAGAYFVLTGLPNLLCGIGLLRGWRGWVLVLAVILGTLNLPNFPIGTALAFYTYWVVYRLYDAGESPA